MKIKFIMLDFSWVLKKLTSFSSSSILATALSWSSSISATIISMTLRSLMAVCNCSSSSFFPHTSFSNLIYASCRRVSSCHWSPNYIDVRKRYNNKQKYKKLKHNWWCLRKLHHPLLQNTSMVVGYHTVTCKKQFLQSFGS